VTASVTHVYTASNLTAANPTISVTDTPAAGDVLVLLVSTTNLAISAVSGCGATWSRVTGAQSASGVLDAWIGVGATSSGTITATGSASNRSLMAFMVSGVTPKVVGVTTSGAGARTTPSQTAGEGQVVIGFSRTDTADNSVTDSTPSTGWTETTGQINSANFTGTVYRTPTTSESHNFTAQRSASTTYVSQIVLGGTRTNLVKNPSFETDLTGWEYQGTGSQDTTEFSNGAASLKVIYSYVGTARAASYGATPPGIATPSANADSIPVAVGQRVTLSANVKVASGTTNHLVKIHWFNSSGTWLSDSQGTNTAMSTSWTRLSVTGVAPTNATHFGVAVQRAGSATTYVDGVLAEITDALLPYFDGSSTNSSYDYAWTGTAHASTSTEDLTGTPIESAFSGEGTLSTTWSNYVNIDSQFSGEGTLSTQWSNYVNVDSQFSAEGTLSTAWSNYVNIDSAFSGEGTLDSQLIGQIEIDSQFSGEGTLSTALTNYKEIDSSFSGEGTLDYTLTLDPAYSGTGTLSTLWTNYRNIGSDFGAEGVLHTELGYTIEPAAIDAAPLRKLVGFNVSASAVPVNPAEGSGSTPSVSATYIKGTNPEYALGENNVLKNGAIGTYEGEIVRLTLPQASDRMTISTATPLSLLNNEMHLFPFIDGVPGTWTAARAIDYWTQQCGLFYDKVPGQCVAYASGFGHTDSYGAGIESQRFYEKAAATTTQVINSRSVRTMGADVTASTKLHEVEDGAVTVSLPKSKKLVFSIGLGLRGTGRTSTVTWSLLDNKKVTHTVSLTATSAGAVTAKLGASTVASATVDPDGNYRLAFSLERLSPTALAGKLTVHTDDLAGIGSIEHDAAASVLSYALPGVLGLVAVDHISSGGSGSQMVRWGTYLTVADSHPEDIPAIQKVLSQTTKSNSFVSGFEGNVWSLLNEYCAITRLEVRFLDGALRVLPRTTAVTLPGRSYSRFEVTSERREKYKEVALVNLQSKAVTNDTAVLWKADSVYQLNTREVFETTVQTEHSILSVANPAPVPGIEPFPYTAGGGQYVVTGADGYIIAPQWWTDNGGKIECSLTGKEGEILIKITAPGIDSVRAPYRISEGEADRPALYISGSGIINDPKEVHVSTGARNAREGFENVFESPFLSGIKETYDTALTLAAQYSASVAEVDFEVPNDFDTATGFGQFPPGTLTTDNDRNYRILETTQTQSRVSGRAIPHTTIGAYVASYPEGATIADEKARHAGKTIRKFNIKPLRGDS
jgi:hypothetical protein